MRSNLPAPSQPWGNDIERRIKELERQVSSLSVAASTLNQAVSGSKSLITGTGTYTVSSSVRLNEATPGGIGAKTELLSIDLDWLSKGTTAQIISIGYFYAGKDNPTGFTAAMDTGLWMYLGVRGSNGVSKEERVPITSGVMLARNFFVATNTVALVADYANYSSATLTMSVEGIASHPHVVNTSVTNAEARLTSIVTIQ